MARPRLLSLTLAVCLLAPLAAVSPAPDGAARAERTTDPAGGAQEADLPPGIEAVLAAFDRMAGRDLWPGFAPGELPLALYDGVSTWLLRHPDPPEGFHAVPGEERAAVFAGRHPTVRANTSTELGGAETAVAILEGRLEEPPARLAGLLLHEAFHVHQRRRHPGWSANEMALLTYPTGDSTVLGLRRLETRALRGALRAGTAEERRARARSALAVRSERFGLLPPNAVAYERKTELNEGLARYVERRAAGDGDRPVFETVAFPPEEVRRRAYATGQALALLLDDAHPAWKERLASDSAATLDGLLRGALPGDGRPSQAARPGAADRRRALARAGRDVRRLERERRERLADFLERPGWRVELVAAAGAPLWPRRFDPLNLLKVDGERVLHTRWLVLGHDAARVEVMDHAALTTAAGEHPLFQGVSRLLVTGLPGPPEIAREGDVVRLEAPALEAEVRGASVERSGRRIVVRLPETPPEEGT